MLISAYFISFYINLNLINMANKLFCEFSQRLIQSMKKQGYGSSRSPSGICMRKLADLANASEQICRRYIRGEALPDYARILRLSSHLNVPAGWLLFGHSHQVAPLNSQTNEDLLRHILQKSFVLYSAKTSRHEEYADFVLELLRQIQTIETSYENQLKIIDMAIGSVSIDRKLTANVG